MTHDIDTRDAIIEDLSDKLESAELVRGDQEREIGRLVTKVMELEREIRLPCAHVKRVQDLEAEVERLKAQPTAAQERAAIVAWLLKFDENWKGAYLASLIEIGKHWPTEGAKCRHCLRTLQVHEQNFCDACSQLEGGKL